MAKASKKVEQSIHIPDIPAQMMDEEKSETIVETYKPSVIIPEEHISIEETVVEETEIKESDEILFLRSVLQKQHDGGFGRHLDEMINNRIKELKSK